MNASTLTALATARRGDSLTITTAGGKVRTVTVTQVDGRYLYVTSGKPRTGHVAGGMVDLKWGTFQPTMQQASKRIEAVTRCAVLAFAV